MSQITAAMVKELRESTGAGMMDCKQALTENNGDMEVAIDWLRTKGLAKAAKKASRTAAEGLIGLASSGNAAAVVELNSETDFVARNEQFQGLVRAVADVALENGGDVAAIAGEQFPGIGKTVAEHISELVGTIGENMNLRRVAKLSVSTGVVASYIHNQVADRLGKIGVLVALESTGDAGKLEEFGRQVAMHIAAVNPLAMTSDEVPQDVADRERAVYAEQARESGKPENIIEKMVEGRMRKFYEESVLLNQTYVIDGESTVQQAIEQAGKDIGSEVKITGFVRFQLGEGIDKGEDDFAAEVAKAAGQG